MINQLDQSLLFQQKRVNEYSNLYQKYLVSINSFMYKLDAHSTGFQSGGKQYQVYKSLGQRKI